MSAPDRRRIVLGSDTHRAFVGSLVASCPAGYVVTIEPPRRSPSQNDIFHALVDAIARARPEWAGMPMSAEDWKALLIVSHATATRETGVRLVPDLEGGGLVQLRESSARMSKARASSLIAYVEAWAASQGIELLGREDGR